MNFIVHQVWGKMMGDETITICHRPLHSSPNRRLEKVRGNVILAFINAPTVLLDTEFCG